MVILTNDNNGDGGDNGDLEPEPEPIPGPGPILPEPPKDDDNNSSNNDEESIEELILTDGCGPGLVRINDLRPLCVPLDENDEPIKEPPHDTATCLAVAVCPYSPPDLSK